MEMLSFIGMVLFSMLQAALMIAAAFPVVAMILWFAYGMYTEVTMTEAERDARAKEYQERHERTEALVYGLADFAGRSIRHQMLKAERHVRHLERDLERTA